MRKSFSAFRSLEINFCDDLSPDLIHLHALSVAIWTKAKSELPFPLKFLAYRYNRWEVQKDMNPQGDGKGKAAYRKLNPLILMTFEFSRSVELTRMWQATLPFSGKRVISFFNASIQQRRRLNLITNYCKASAPLESFHQINQKLLLSKEITRKVFISFFTTNARETSKVYFSMKALAAYLHVKISSLLCSLRRQISFLSKKIQSGAGKNCKTIVSKRRAKAAENGSTIIGLRNEICLSFSHANSQQLMARKRS